MARRKFLIKDYTIRLGDRLPVTIDGMRVEARGIVTCIGPNNQRVAVYFLADSSPIADATTTRGGRCTSIFLPKEMMGLWVDLLRNEKPLFACVNTDHPERTCLSTRRETVGEGEEESAQSVETAVFWTQQEPLADAAALENVHWIARALTNSLQGKEAANRICDIVLDRGLRRGEIAIWLQNFGIGHGDPAWPEWWEHNTTPLFLHREDGLRERPEDIDWWRTPWFDTGLAIARDWMDEFIGQYQTRQASDGIADPTRFTFDVETRFSAMYDGSWVHVFPYLQRDERYRTKTLLGFDVTLAELFEQADIAFNPEISGWQPDNYDFMNWWEGVTLTLIEAGLNEVAYQPIREAWPGAQSSNYYSSAKIDGQGDPPRFEGSLLRTSHPWMAYCWRQWGDLQAPRFYWTTREEEALLGLETKDALVWIIDHMMPWYLESYGPNDPATITPWIQAIGEHRTEPDGRTLTHRPEWARAQIEALREWGVQEFIVYSAKCSQLESYWNEFAKIVRRN